LVKGYFTIFFLLLFSASFAQIVFETTVGDVDCYEEAFTAYGSALYVVSANYNCNNGPGNFSGSILLLDENGDSITTKSNFKGSGFYALDNTENNNKFIFAGGEKSGLIYDTIILSKIDDTFNKEWEKKYVLGQCNNVVYDVAVADDGYLFTGFYSTQNCQNASYDAFVLKLDKDGNELWLTDIKGSANQQFYAVRPLPNNEVAAFGWTSNTTSELSKFFLVKFNANGDSVSSFIIDNIGEFRGYGMDVTPDGHYIISGTRNNNEIILMKTDSVGNIIWSKNIGIPCGSSYYKSYLTLDNEYVFSFIKSGDLGCETTLMKTDTAGNELWSKVFPATIRTVTQPEKGAFLLAGFKLRTGNFVPDSYIARFDTTFTADTSLNVLNNIPLINNINVYPNPSSARNVTFSFSNLNYLPVQIFIHDVTGKEILNQFLFQQKQTINLNNSTSNILFYTIKYNSSTIDRGKILLH
jgi:hypothetical protein